MTDAATGPTATLLALAIYLDGADDPDQAADGRLLLDDDFLVLVNAWWEPLDFVIPATRTGQAWQADIDSYHGLTPATDGPRPHGGAGDKVTVGPRSVSVLRFQRRGLQRQGFQRRGLQQRGLQQRGAPVRLSGPRACWRSAPAYWRPRSRKIRSCRVARRTGHLAGSHRQRGARRQSRVLRRRVRRSRAAVPGRAGSGGSRQDHHHQGQHQYQQPSRAGEPHRRRTRPMYRGIHLLHPVFPVYSPWIPRPLLTIGRGSDISDGANPRSPVGPIPRRPPSWCPAYPAAVERGLSRAWPRARGDVGREGGSLRARRPHAQTGTGRERRADNRQRQLKTGRLHRAMPLWWPARSHPVTCGRVVHKLVDNPRYVRITACILWTSCGLRKEQK